MLKRILTFIFTSIGAVLGFGISDLLINGALNGIESGIPAHILVAIFFTIPAVFSTAAFIISNMFFRVSYYSHDKTLAKCITFMMIVSTFGTFTLSAGMQKLYELGNDSVNMSIVLDVSGSMEGKYIEDSAEAAKDIVDSLDNNDKVGLIFFSNNDSQVKSPMGKLTSTKKQLLKNILNNIEITNTSSEIQPALDQLKKNITTTDKSRNVVFLISDLVNVGQIDESTQSFIKNNTTLYIFNISSHENKMLKSLCEASGGKYLNSSDSEDVKELCKSMSYSTMLLNETRSTNWNGNFWVPVISCSFFILLGSIMCIVYTAFYNNKKVRFVWNLLMATTVVAIMEINNFVYQEPLIMLGAMILIFPTMYLGKIYDTPTPEHQPPSPVIQDNNVNLYESSHLLG